MKFLNKFTDFYPLLLLKVVNVVSCSRQNAPVFGQIACTSSLVRKCAFTGATSTGKWLLQQCADSVKKVSMELGGNAPSIVFNSADLRQAAALTALSRFTNSGQTCICVERVFVQEESYDEFMTYFVAEVEALTVRDPLLYSSRIGPVINENAIQKLEVHVRDAKEKGATVVTGGRRLRQDGLSYEPTIVTDCTPNMLCMQHETFGPLLAPVCKFKTEEEVLQMANTRESGLAAYVFSNEYQQIWSIAEELEVGMVGRVPRPYFRASYNRP